MPDFLKEIKIHELVPEENVLSRNGEEKNLCLDPQQKCNEFFLGSFHHVSIKSVHFDLFVLICTLAKLSDKLDKII